MTYKKEFAPACDRNSRVILDVLCNILSRTESVLEIGSGTGQHAVYFARHLPHLRWIPSDRPGQLDSIRAWSLDARLSNLMPPEEVDLLDDETEINPVDAMVCINTIHIVAWQGTARLFQLVAENLLAGGIMYVYGPYRYADQLLAPSNESFDEWLKVRDPVSGVRDFEAVNQLAIEAGLELQGDIAMPANNRSIWWQKRGV